MKTLLKKIFKKLPPIRRLLEERDSLKQERDFYFKFFKFVPPGHFYSPIPSVDDVNNMKNVELPVSIPGIELNTEKQLQLLNEFNKYYSELPFSDNKSEKLRYYYNNTSYSYSDAILLYCMIRHIKPTIIVEVGCGYSSCMILDTNELYFENKIKCKFIDPYPDLLKSLITTEDKNRIEIIGKKLQEVSLEDF
jgi:hypothetical protein